MRPALLLALLLTGCTQSQPHQPAAEEPMHYPCPPAPRGPGVLPLIVDAATLRVWADKDEAARKGSVRARNECARSLRRAIGEEPLEDE